MQSPPENRLFLKRIFLLGGNFGLFLVGVNLLRDVWPWRGKWWPTELRRGWKEVRFRSQAQCWQRVAHGWGGGDHFFVVVVAAAFKGEIEQMNLKNPTKSINLPAKHGWNLSYWSIYGMCQGAALNSIVVSYQTTHRHTVIHIQIIWMSLFPLHSFPQHSQGTGYKRNPYLSMRFDSTAIAIWHL